MIVLPIKVAKAYMQKVGFLTRPLKYLRATRVISFVLIVLCSLNNVFAIIIEAPCTVEPHFVCPMHCLGIKMRSECELIHILL